MKLISMCCGREINRAVVGCRCGFSISRFPCWHLNVSLILCSPLISLFIIEQAERISDFSRNSDVTTAGFSVKRRKAEYDFCPVIPVYLNRSISPSAVPKT